MGKEPQILQDGNGKKNTHAKMKPILTDDYKEFIGLLITHKVDFLFCGGHVVAFHGYPRLTMDFEILIRPSNENADKLMIVLDEFGFGRTGI